VRPLSSVPIAAVLAGVLAASAAGPALAQSFAITNARIETAGPQGVIERGTVLVEAGRVRAVGAGVAVPTGTQVVDAGGQTVSPGLILPSSSLGVAEISQVPSTRDDGAGPQLGAAFDPSAGVNPDTPMVQLARLNGVTRVFVTPVAGRSGAGDGHAHDDSAFAMSGADSHASDPALFAGQVSAMSLAAGAASPVTRAGLAVVLDLGEAGAVAAGGSRGASIVLLRQVLADVRHYKANRAAYDAGEGRDLILSRMDLLALVPVVEGRVPLLVRVSRAADIRVALSVARAERVRVILEGAEEGWQVAGEIAAAGVPVIVSPEANLPASFEAIGSTLENAALLARAGVNVAIMGSRDANNLRQSRFSAGLAASYGMDRSAALQAVTLVPARLYGLERETGSIEPGKQADLVIWTGDPLEPLSYPVAVYIGGVAQPLDARSVQLARRYRPQGEGAPPPAYRQ
jgi:imidazolonepropionase-like amidohydrolase